ncbi:MAG: hypothetical protein JWO08_3361 [Verrucomicrobiaceae bacterium]|nr:hypothetical protein [Verrucomicrobiaceae bacterium]
MEASRGREISRVFERGNVPNIIAWLCAVYLLTTRTMRRISWFFLLLPLIAMAMFYHRPSQPSAGAKPVAQASLSAMDHLIGGAPKADDDKETERRRRFEEGRQQSAEAIRRDDEAGKKLAVLLTPQYRASTVDRVLKLRNPQYQSLFDSWKIDRGVRDDILTLVRDRELRWAESRAKAFAGGHTAMPTYEADKLFNESLSQMQLSKLLGKACSDELAKLETEMFQQEHPNIRPRVVSGDES